MWQIIAYTETCGKYCTEEGRVTIPNIRRCLKWHKIIVSIYMLEIFQGFFGQFNILKNTVINEIFHLKYFNATSLVRSGSIPSAKGRPNYVMGFGGGGPNGVQRQSPWSVVRGTKSPLKLMTFSYFRDEFLNKINT